MKIIAYMNLTPDQIELDTAQGTVVLAKSARHWQMELYPSVADAARSLRPDTATYAVTAEVPDGSVFEVRGHNDQSEGRRGLYLAGLFDNFPAAFAAAAGLGVMGGRGELNVLPAPVNVLSTFEEWKAASALNPGRAADSELRIDLRRVVELAPNDPQALGAADPLYAVWLKLNAKYAPDAGTQA